MEKDTVKIRTKKGRIITLTISEESDGVYYMGTDKFGKNVIINVNDIYSMMPCKEEENE